MQNADFIKVLEKLRQIDYNSTNEPGANSPGFVWYQQNLTFIKEDKIMARFTLPRDLYHGKGALEVLKTLTGSRAMVCVGGGSLKRFGFLDRVVSYLV